MSIKEHVAPGSNFIFTITEEDAEQRLDLYLSHLFERYSRSFFKKLISEGHITINGQSIKAGYVIKAGEQISVTFPSLPEIKYVRPFDKDIGVEVVAEEPDFLILYKPAGLMVHRPTAYAEDVTLVDWLLASYKDLVSVGVEDRPGIVHRLDKDTSGLLIIPRTSEAHMNFGNLFRDRAIEKVYWALVKGHPDRSGTIDFSIGRDPVQKHRMIHLPSRGKSRNATTHYKVLAYYPDYSLVEVRLITGRTHQIRVHFAAIGHPVLGDPLYGEPSKLIKRQALHAKHIAFDYKGTHYVYDFPVPDDMQKLIDKPTV